MLRIEFDKQNVARATQLVAKLRGAGDPGAERLRLFTHLGVAVLRWVDQNFASAGSLVGGWKPLAPNTVFGRRKGSDVPLSDTGALRRSFTAAATDEDLRVGTAVQIAKYHQFGTDPYVIRPKKPGGVLAFFGAPMSSLTTRQTRTTLRRKRPGAPNVGLVSARAARLGGLSVPAGRGALQSLIFAREVHHPGLAARRMLPTAAEITEIVAAVGQDWLRTMRRSA